MTPEELPIAVKDKTMVSASESKILVYHYRVHGSRSGSDENGRFFTGTWEIAILDGVVVVFGFDDVNSV